MTLADTNMKQTTSEQICLNTIKILLDKICTQDKITGQQHFIGKGEILQAYGWSEYQFKKLVKSGLPVRIKDRTLYANRHNIDEWFKAWTMVNSKNTGQRRE